MATRIPFSKPMADARCVSYSCGGERERFAMCECVKFTDLLTYQLQFKAGSDIDEKLSEKTKVLKRFVCDSVNEKPFYLRKQWSLPWRGVKRPVWLAKSRSEMEAQDSTVSSNQSWLERGLQRRELESSSPFDHALFGSVFFVFLNFHDNSHWQVRSSLCWQK